MNKKPLGVFSVRGVRYQVPDVARAAAFYTVHLGFNLAMQHPPAFASVSLGDFVLLLSGPEASGSRPMPSGECQLPGGWNRVVLRVADLPAQIDGLTNAGIKFRNRMESGSSGRQIQLEDPGEDRALRASSVGGRWLMTQYAHRMSQAGRVLIRVADGTIRRALAYRASADRSRS